MKTLVAKKKCIQIKHDKLGLSWAQAWIGLFFNFIVDFVSLDWVW